MDGIELMATAMQAMQERVDIAAVNLANASSDGFRRSVARTTLGTRGLATSTVVDDRGGALRRTGRALDLAVAGPAGEILVRDAAGPRRARCEQRFVRTRGARRHVAGDGRGRALLGDARSRCAPAPNRDDRRTRRRPQRRCDRRPDPRVASRGDACRAGALEGSNVDAIREMVDVLTAQRSFETAEKALGALDDTRSKASNDVARVKA